jgi:hypothetical protein
MNVRSSFANKTGTNAHNSKNHRCVETAHVTGLAIAYPFQFITVAAEDVARAITAAPEVSVSFAALGVGKVHLIQNDQRQCQHRCQAHKIHLNGLEVSVNRSELEAGSFIFDEEQKVIQRSLIGLLW